MKYLNKSSQAIFVLILLIASISSIIYVDEFNDKFPLMQETEQYESIIVYRNDDVDEATSEEFQRINKIFVENDVPVTHGIVPLWIKERNDTQKQCREFRSLEEEYPELVHFSLHGYTHELEGNPPSEFEDKPKEVQNQKIDDAVAFFENCLDRTPETFIPPGNTHDQTTLEVLNEHNFNLLSGHGPHYEDEWIYNEDRIPYEKEDVYQKGMQSMFVELWDERRLIRWSKLKDEVNQSIDQNNLHTQMIHYKMLDSYSTEEKEDGFQKLEQLVEFTSRKSNSTHLNMAQLSKKLDNERINVREGGWEVAE